MNVFKKFIERYNKKFYTKQIDSLKNNIKSMSDKQLINEDKSFTCREDFNDGNRYTRVMHDIIEEEMELRGIQTESELREDVWFAQH